MVGLYPFSTFSPVGLCVLHLSSSHARTSSIFSPLSFWKPATRLILFIYVRVIRRAYIHLGILISFILGWSLGGARERLRIRKVLAYFTEKHGRRHFNDGISIYFACTVSITILSSHLHICFQKFQMCRFEFRGFRPPGRHRVSRVSEKNMDLGVRLC